MADKALLAMMSFSAIVQFAYALPTLVSKLSPNCRSMPTSIYVLERYCHEFSRGERRTQSKSELSPKKLILRGGKLDGFSAVIIENLAAADHFESLLCTSRTAITNAFRSIDLDDSGHISRVELKDALHILGVNATDSEVESIFNGLDENKDGGINFEVLNQYIY